MQCHMFEINISKTAGEISPLWFGHNLEHTRSCLWRGLSAELIRNRKFTGLPDRNGVAQHWYRIGPRECWHLLEEPSSKCWHLMGEPSSASEIAGNAYTSHFDYAIHVNEATIQRQKVQCLRDGVPCGIGQKGIFLTGGNQYEGQLALQSDRALTVQVRGQGLDREYFETTLKIRPGEWREFYLTFTAPVTDKNARIEITFSQIGTLYLGAISLLPSGHFHRMRRDVIDLLKEISIPILRWPGGNFAGDYRWKDGLLPVDCRAPLRSYVYHTLPHTGGCDNHEVGTDEFIALCRELGAEPYITTNIGLEGPEEAAAWVEYCNGSPDTTWGKLRAQRGHPKPYNVKYWSLGNEMGYGHMSGPNTPTEYREKAIACAKAMKKIDPTIVLTSSGAWWQEEWYSCVLAHIERHLDHVSYHTYTPLMTTYEGEEGEEEFRRITKASDDVLEDLKKVRVQLDTYASSGNSMGLSFDEWNVWYAWYRVPGVAEGIYTASMLNMLCREARQVGIAIGTYFEPVNEGAIVVDSTSCRLTPAGQVFCLYRAHHGNQLIQVEVPIDDSDLDLIASVDRSKKEVAITLVNRSVEKSRETGFVLKDIRNIVKTEYTLLSSMNFLPGSEFTQQQLETKVTEKRFFSVSLPPHSVARILTQYQ